MNEKVANRLLEVIGKPIVEIYGINFIAVRKDNLGDYYLQIGYNSKKIKLESQVYGDITHIINKNPIIDRSLKKYEKNFLSYETETILASTIDTQSDFGFHNENISSGSEIYRQRYSLQSGTLGAFVTMEKKSGVYFITNHHVVMKNYTKLGKKIIHKTTGKVFGELFWGILNDYYDVAIVKVLDQYNSDIVSSTTCFNFSGGIDFPEIGMNVSKSGAASSCNFDKDKTILSRNAFVYLEDKVFKNQILTSKISIPGDSGSVVVNLKNKNIVGLVIGGDEENYSVCNNIDVLFNNYISPMPYKYRENGIIKTGNLPDFQIKSILTK